MAEGGFDLAPLCHDPAHYGQDPHAPGDYLLPHQTVTNIRIPDFGENMASIEFQIRENGVWRTFGAPTSSMSFSVNR